MDHKAFLAQLSKKDRDSLTQKSDLAGLRHLAAHCALIVSLGTLIALKVPGWPSLLPLQGVSLVFLFTLQHEATHKTPFASEGLNEWVGWACGIVLIQPFLWFRYFHLAHHRYTNLPGQDPELGDTPKPETWPALLWHLSAFGYWRDKADVLWTCAFGSLQASYLPDRVHGRLRREARAMLLIYMAALAFCLTVWPSLLWVWIVPMIFGFPVLRLYLLAEHGRCPMVTNMLLNTRTTYTNAFVRFLAWNMPYHAEHHVFPQVPFHKLPQFNADLRDYLNQTSPGYRAFARTYVQGFSDLKHDNTSGRP